MDFEKLSTLETRHDRRVGAKVKLGLLIVVVASVACSGSDRPSSASSPRDAGTGGSASGACQITGARQQMPYALQHAAAAGPDGYVVVAETGGFGSEDWSTFTLEDGVLAEHDVSVGQSPLALAGNSTTTAAFAPGRLVMQVDLRRWDGAAWTVDDAERSAPFAGADFSKGAALALDAQGGFAAVWIEGGFGSALSARVSRYVPGEGFAPFEDAFTPADGTEGPEIYAAFGPDGDLHVLGRRSSDAGAKMIYRRRLVEGAWGAVVEVGPVPGALANVSATGLAVTADGAVYVAEAHGRDSSADVDGAVLVYRVEGGTAEVVARIDDDRIVVEALAIAPLGDRVVVAVAHGANNFDPAASDDSIEVYACDVSGCSAALKIAPEPGIFYESLSIAARDDEVAVVWAQTPKGGIAAPEANFVVRVGCP